MTDISSGFHAADSPARLSPESVETMPWLANLSEIIRNPFNARNHSSLPLYSIARRLVPMLHSGLGFVQPITIHFPIGSSAVRYKNPSKCSHNTYTTKYCKFTAYPFSPTIFVPRVIPFQSTIICTQLLSFVILLVRIECFSVVGVFTYCQLCIFLP